LEVALIGVRATLILLSIACQKLVELRCEEEDKAINR
jgi:hypothetical protein